MQPGRELDMEQAFKILCVAGQRSLHKMLCWMRSSASDLREAGRSGRNAIVPVGCATLIISIGSASADELRRSQSDYTSARDWFLQAESIGPHGRNPWFFPLVPGHKHILEKSINVDEKYRKETMVLEQTEPFDVDGIGKFEAAIVQEEEFIDEELAFRLHSWVGIDKRNNSVLLFGQVSWEVDEDGNTTVADTWRAGEQDGATAIKPGMLMPGMFTVGARFLSGGKESEPIGGFEAIEAGIEVTVPAGTFTNCVRMRQQDLSTQKKDAVDRIWCPQLGLASDSASGQLIATNALPSGHPGADVSSFGTYSQDKQAQAAPDPKITSDQAKEVALKVVQGRITSVVIERKKGKHVYVVEIMTPGGAERDVLVDIETGQVVGTE